MARIRTIKPEFPQSETIGKLSRDARLLFIQLWTVADDHGRAKANPKLLASLLYPYDADAAQLMGGWLTELQNNGCIRLYENDRNSYLDIPNWNKHQRIDNAGKSHIPEFRREPPRTAANDGDSRLDLGPRTKDLGSRKEKESRAVARSPSASFAAFWQLYPNKVGKAAALAAFLKVEKAGAVSHGELMAGLERYCKKGDDRPWCNPATWLNQGRWEDQPAEVPNGQGRSVLAAADRLIDRLRAEGASDDYVPGSSGPRPLELDRQVREGDIKLVSSR